MMKLPEQQMLGGPLVAGRKLLILATIKQSSLARREQTGWADLSGHVPLSLGLLHAALHSLHTDPILLKDDEGEG
jgi:hypothetical protein